MEDMRPVERAVRAANLIASDKKAKKSDSKADKKPTHEDINDQIAKFVAGGKITKCPDPVFDQDSRQVGITGNYMGGGVV